MDWNCNTIQRTLSFLPLSRNYSNVTSSWLSQDYTCSRIIYAPLSFSGQQVLNRSLSQAEYINVLTWQANSNNESIVKYRIYQVEGNDRTLIIELNADAFRYIHRGVDKDALYTYSLIAVNDEGREGVSTSITIQ